MVKKNFCDGFYCFCQQGHHGFCDVIYHKCDRISAILWDIATVCTVVVVGLFRRKSRAVFYSQSVPGQDMDGCLVCKYTTIAEDLFLKWSLHEHAQLLIPIIQWHVRKGSTIYSDSWRAYVRSLTAQGYNHYPCAVSICDRAVSLLWSIWRGIISITSAVWSSSRLSTRAVTFHALYVTLGKYH